MLVCKRCNSDSLYLQKRGNNIGLYCSECKSWQKWVGKSEYYALIERGIAVRAEVQEQKEQGVKIKEPEKCKRCGNAEFFVRPSEHGTHTGLYCTVCGAWQKWLSKKDKQIRGVIDDCRS